MKLTERIRNLEEIVNALLGQHQQLVERVNNLEILRARVGVEATDEEKLKLAIEATNQDREAFKNIKKVFCGSQ